MNLLAISIEASYQKVYEITAELVGQAMESLEEPDMSTARKQDLLKQAHDKAYEFVDSVVNVGKYTHNQELIQKIQDTHMDGAITMYDRIFDEFYGFTKVWAEVAPSRE